MTAILFEAQKPFLLNFAFWALSLKVDVEPTARQRDAKAQRYDLRGPRSFLGVFAIQKNFEKQKFSVKFSAI